MKKEIIINVTKSKDNTCSLVLIKKDAELIQPNTAKRLFVVLEDSTVEIKKELNIYKEHHYLQSEEINNWVFQNDIIITPRTKVTKIIFTVVVYKEDHVYIPYSNLPNLHTRYP